MDGALRIVVFALALAWAVAVGTVADAQTPSTADPRPVTLRVATFPDNRPWVFRDEQGRLVGFEVDLIGAVASRLGTKVDFVFMPFSELLAQVASGQVDLAVCSITITDERRARVDFTQPYYETSQGVVMLKSERIRTLAELAGKRVATAAGTTNAQWLDEHRRRYRYGPTIAVQGLDEGLALLQDGEADAYFGDLPALLYSLLTRPNLAVALRLPTEDRYAVALARGSHLTFPVDAALSELKRNGTLAAIHQRWFGSAPPPDTPVTKVLPRP